MVNRMTERFSGYSRVEKVYEGHHSLIFRGRDEKNNRSVILKCLKNDYPQPGELAVFEREYRILDGMDIHGVVKGYSLEKWGNGLMIVQEDFQGRSLRDYLGENDLDLEEFLRIAVKTVEILGDIHKKAIIHKDINPGNILYNPDTGEIKIIDFGIASEWERETSEENDTHFQEGTVAYVSPEQTGRMNCPMDYRTDFYSLGVMFYEILTRSVPFNGEDMTEIIHAHMARKPVPPHEIESKIPTVVSNIVVKLMAKPAEERYQSAFGLLYDLKRCLEQLEAGLEIEDFEIGSADELCRFRIPDKLYGREREMALLRATFDRAGNGEAELLLVKGYAGIGKSALVSRIHKHVTGRQGHFISGKADQMKRNIPYSSLIQVFQEYVKQLLTESEESIAGWKKKLLEVLGKSGRIIVDVIPTLELIIGPQPKVPELPPQESQNRFIHVFKNFVRAFAGKDYPPAIFLDDLQWIDSASLDLLEAFLTDPQTRHILFIGAYRDNETDNTHPLMLMLYRIREAGAAVSSISLGPLDVGDVETLIVDTLKCRSSAANPLARLCMLKTGGNPFFLRELLYYLYKKGLLAFNDASGRWQWNIKDIQEMGITENVVELLTGKITNMPANTGKLLKLASCIGGRFDLHTLAIAAEMPPEETLTGLWPALREQMVIPLEHLDAQDVGNNNGPVLFKFSHDRIRQAAYMLIPEEERGKVHMEVGQLMLKRIPPAQWEEQIFEILHQLNLGREYITAPALRIGLADLNLKGGRKAKLSTAFPQAFGYLQTGLSLLDESCWESHYGLTLGLHIDTAEAAYLNGQFQLVDQLAPMVLEKVRLLPDRVKMHGIVIHALTLQNKLPEAVSEGLKVLRLFGIKFPRKPGKLNLVPPLLRVKMLMRGRTIEELADLPEMTDTTKQLVMRVLTDFAYSAYFISPELFALSVLKQVEFSLIYGNSYVSCFSYSCYAVLLSVMGDIESSYRFGRLSLKLLERIEARELKARIISNYGVFVEHWKEPLSNTLEVLIKVFQSSLEIGDLEYGAWALYFLSMHSFFTGKELSRLEKDMTLRLEAIAKIGQEKQRLILLISRQVVLNFMGKSENPTALKGESWDRASMVRRMVEADDKIGLFVISYSKFMLSSFFRDYETAVEDAEVVKKHLSHIIGSAYCPIFYFHDSLVRLGLYDRMDRAGRRKILKAVSLNQDKIKKWAEKSPENNWHKYYLVEAERFRVLGRETRAMDYYDRAVKLAKENDFIQEEALANQLAGRFYLSRDKEKIARVYINDAHYCYRRWGAAALVEKLEEEYSRFFDKSPEMEKDTRQTKKIFTSSDFFSSESLDLKAIMKASHAMAREIVLSQLLKKMMKIVIENAGAQKGFLVLNSTGELRVEAEVFSDGREVEILQSIPLEKKDNLSTEIINYTARTKESVVLDDACKNERFAGTPYVKANKPKSVLCLPLVHQELLTGILYLENNMTTHAFTRERVGVLEALTSQAAISIENALLYERVEAGRNELQKHRDHLEELVRERTNQLSERNRELETLNRVVETINREMEFDKLLDSLLEQTMAFFPRAERGIFLLYDHKSEEFRVATYKGKAPGIISNISYTYEEAIEHFMNGAREPEAGVYCRKNPEGIVNAVLSMPVEIDDRVEGFLILENMSDPQAFGQADILQMSHLSGHAISAILKIKSMEELQREREKADRANRAKSEFLANVSHEIRTPMNAVLGFTEIMEAEITDKKHRHYLEAVSSSGRTLLRLINDILDLSRIEAGKMELHYEPVSPGLVLNEIKHIFSNKVREKDLDFVLEVDPLLPELVSLDGLRLRQVLLNLVGNAVKFTDAGFIKLSAFRGNGWDEVEEVKQGGESYFPSRIPVSAFLRVSRRLFSMPSCSKMARVP